MRRTAIVVVLLLVGGANAYAQQLNRGYLQAIGGFTFGTEPSELFGGGAGLSLGHGVHVIFEGGRMGDVVPKSVRRDLDDTMRMFSAETGVTATATIKAPATYFASGLRFAAPVRGRIIPYVAFTVGSARLSPELSVDVAGSRVIATDEELEESGLTSDRQALIGVGAGVEVAVARRFAVELGYQYNRIFTKDPAVNTHRAFTGVNVKF